jgi:hypothetical protein
MNVYRFGDDPREYQYIAARNDVDATLEYAALFSTDGLPSVHHALTEEELDTTMVDVETEDGTFTGMTQTMREQLRESLDVEDTAPFFLCGTE